MNFGIVMCGMMSFLDDDIQSLNQIALGSIAGFIKQFDVACVMRIKAPTVPDKICFPQSDSGLSTNMGWR